MSQHRTRDLFGAALVALFSACSLVSCSDDGHRHGEDAGSDTDTDADADTDTDTDADTDADADTDTDADADAGPDAGDEIDTECLAADGGMLAEYVYAWDDGAMDNAGGLGVGGDSLWLNAFEAVSCGDEITSIDVMYGVIAAGHAATVLLYDDPDDDGNPDDAVLLESVETTMESPGTGTWERVAIPATAVDGWFFVGVLCTYDAGEWPSAYDDTVSRGHSWLAVNTTQGAIDPSDIVGTASSIENSEDYFGDYNWMVRADNLSPDTDTATDTDVDTESDSECLLADGGVRDEVVYSWDDGTLDTSYGLGAGGDLWWVNAFDALSCGTAITSIDTMWANVPAGLEVSVLLYEDPDDDGDPGDAVLLERIDTTVSSPNTGTWQRTEITPTTVHGWFFAGLLCSHSSMDGEWPEAQDTGVSRGHSWETSGGMGEIDPADVPGTTSNPIELTDDNASPGNWMIRANSLPAATGADAGIDAGK
jgi:hypothetical protein